MRSGRTTRLGLTLAWILWGPLAVATSPAAFGQPNTVSETKFLSWVAETAIHLDTLAWQDVDLEKLSFLDTALRGKRFIFLGEPDHYVHEKFDFQTLLIHYLVNRGWRNLSPIGSLDATPGEMVGWLA